MLCRVRIQQFLKSVTQNGYTAQCSVGVSTSIISLSVSPTSKTLNVGETVQLTGIKNPTSASEGTQWTSSNTGVATVSGSGLVTAKAAGTATITFKNSSSTKSASCTITVASEIITIEYSNASGSSWLSADEIYLAKYDSNGNLKSNKKITSKSLFTYGLLTYDDCFISGGSYLRITKYNSDGNEIWHNQLSVGSIDEFVTITVTDDNYIFAGGSYEYLYKFDSNGNIIWKNKFSIANGDTIDTIKISPDRNNIFFSSSYAKIVKLDSNGNKIWSKQLDIANSSYASLYDISYDNSTYIRVNNGKYLRKYDSNGNLSWSKDISGNIKAAPDNSFFAINTNQLNKYDSNGNLKWSKKFSGSIIPIKIYLNNIFLAIRVDDAGAYLVKYDINGNETFSKNLNIKNDNRFSLKQIRIK